MAAEAHQEAERQAALGRLLDVARRNTGPEWDTTKPWRGNAGRHP